MSRATTTLESTLTVGVAAGRVEHVDQTTLDRQRPRLSRRPLQCKQEGIADGATEEEDWELREVVLQELGEASMEDEDPIRGRWKDGSISVIEGYTVGEYRNLVGMTKKHSEIACDV